ncbi:hypothetical protein AB395_00006332 (plasmid) [Sinorhizobium fredii CCBAU 45436]|nr:hypothetical protein AB395_00006332 [Sinorhizobium fredii CCBAU 45436]
MNCSAQWRRVEQRRRHLAPLKAEVDPLQTLGWYDTNDGF